MIRFFKSSKDISLMDVICFDCLQQTQLDAFLATWDIEAEGGNRGLLLAKFKAQHPELAFTPYIGPRLDGLLRYFRFRNMPLMAELNKVAHSFNDRGIRYAVIGDGAMKCLYPDSPRDMSRIQILVDTNDITEAKNILHSIGTQNVSVSDTFWGVESLKPTIAHCLDQTSVVKLNGTAVRTLALEDMAWLLLLQAGYSLVNNQQYLLPTIVMDVRQLFSNPDTTFHMERLQRRIRQSATSATIDLTLRLFKTYLPPELNTSLTQERYPKRKLIILMAHLLYNRLINKQTI